MGLGGFMHKLQSKLEVFRLEKRYTRSRHRRSTFISNAVYVDGEYVHQSPNITGGSSSHTGSSERVHGGDALHGPPLSPASAPPLSPLPPLSPGFASEREDELDDLPTMRNRDLDNGRRGNRFSTYSGYAGSGLADEHVENPNERQRERVNRWSAFAGFAGSYADELANLPDPPPRAEKRSSKRFSSTSSFGQGADGKPMGAKERRRLSFIR